MPMPPPGPQSISSRLFFPLCRANFRRNPAGNPATDEQRLIPQNRFIGVHPWPIRFFLVLVATLRFMDKCSRLLHCACLVLFAGTSRAPCCARGAEPNLACSSIGDCGRNQRYLGWVNSLAWGISRE